MSNAGKMLISEEFLLDWLDFKGGKIRNVFMDNDKLGVVALIIEHPDMPEVVGDYVDIVNPAYTKETDNDGHLVKVYRSYPMKRN